MRRMVIERVGHESFADELIEESPDALLALDLDGRMLSWNRGAERIFGLPRRRRSTTRSTS